MRRERREARERVEQLEQELQAVRSQAPAVPEAIQQELVTLRDVQSKHEYLVGALRRHPDILEALDARERAAGTPGYQPPTAAGTRTQGEEIPAWAKNIQKQLDEVTGKVGGLHGTWEQQQQAAREQQEQAQLQQTGQQIDRTIQSWLSGKQLSGEVFFEDARDYILREAALLPDAEIEDIPFLLGRWYKREMLKDQHRRDSYVSRKQEQARSNPPAIIPNASPVQGRPDYGALDSKTSAVLEKGLRDLGWGAQ